MRIALLAVLAALSGCFDFSELTECNGNSDYVCDNFESGAPSPAWFPFMPGAVSGVVDATKPHHGTRSLHVTGAPSSGDEFQLQWKDVPQTAGTTIYVRAYVFVPAAPANTFSLFTMIEPATFTGVRVFVESTGGMQLHDGISGPDAESSAPIPIGRWACLEWEVVESNTGSMTLWLDDTMVAGLSGDTLPATKLGQVGVGAVFQPTIMSQVPLELWLDDVIVDDQRITCHQ